jgi:hypothetical protein
MTPSSLVFGVVGGHGGERRIVEPRAKGGSLRGDADDSDGSDSDDEESVHSPIFDRLKTPAITLSTIVRVAWRAAGGKLSSGAPALNKSPMPKREGGCAWALAEKEASLGDAHSPEASRLRIAATAMVWCCVPFNATRLCATTMYPSVSASHL